MNKKKSAQIGLLIVAIIWGLTFVMVKDALNDAPPFSFAALRFGLATFLIITILNRMNAKIKIINKRNYKGEQKGDIKIKSRKNRK